MTRSERDSGPDWTEAESQLKSASSQLAARPESRIIVLARNEPGTVHGANYCAWSSEAQLLHRVWTRRAPQGGRKGGGRRGGRTGGGRGIDGRD